MNYIWSTGEGDRDGENMQQTVGHNYYETMFMILMNISGLFRHYILHL